MNYRSFADLETCIVKNLHKVPRDIDLIVGVPRSGILVAAMLALYLNLPHTDIEGLIEGRILLPGKRLKHLNSDDVIPMARRCVLQKQP